MKHPTSRLLHAYWDRLRGERAAPERSEIEPGEIRNLLADSLILEIEPQRRQAAFRLAGTRLCALFGRELRGSAFSELWDRNGGDPTEGAWRLVETVTMDTLGVVAGLRGLTAASEIIELELLLLPLRHRGRTQARVLGALSPHCVPAWLGLHPVKRLEVNSLRVLGPARVPEAAKLPTDIPMPANDPLPVRRGHLLVHEGGRL
ncbi:PAS domain-containing protein [Methylobacterium gnaphalii]|uniref:PAS domain-containing protein n=1 Tax=Methylobacterium gnaphalii TaxID=1010610 RepID=A0A512JHS2_9HYPH|nr:PAS domain-containing protein [Methylobacterium gnaphalii]GEP09511.1 PAS domain-containing protein [Methylobacterium gnaphalii]GJD70280.1 hypothetical protein MMMDOFMJ_3225 [Methylobacterium gnaphalii]GLS51715.1 PAS domain-containing protein [Methylobacterium gnaphalii]